MLSLPIILAKMEIIDRYPVLRGLWGNNILILCWQRYRYESYLIADLVVSIKIKKTHHLEQTFRGLDIYLLKHLHIFIKDI